MKAHHSLKTEREAVRQLEAFLGKLPGCEIEQIAQTEELSPDNGIAIRVQGRLAGQPLNLAVEVKSNGQPRIVRETAAQLRRRLERTQDGAIPIVMAPYLSPQSRAICLDEKAGYLDFMGNAHIASGTIYISREVPGRPDAVRRSMVSIFKPKSARILRCLMADPSRVWRTATLAESAQVSLGLVATVGAALRDRGWAEQTDDGFTLTDPSELLDSWAADYERPKGEVHRCYSAFHGLDFDEKLLALAGEAGRVALASFSAAQWLAPYARQSNHYFYADVAGLEVLDELLSLRTAQKGGNVIIVVPDEDGVLDDAIELDNGRMVTSPVQTYLDLMQSGDRGEEAAAHLRKIILDNPT